jgi:propionyl-CoA carboxylase alpha chain
MPPQTAAYDHASGEIVVSYRAGREGVFDIEVGEWRGRVTVLANVHGWIEFEQSQDSAAGTSSGPVTSRHRLHVCRRGGHVWAQGPTGDAGLVEQPRFPDAGADPGVEGGLVAPMPGAILSVEVGQGDAVVEGQLLMILEAMKMEHRVIAPHAGVIAEIRAHAGDQVNGGDVLVVLES